MIAIRHIHQSQQTAVSKVTRDVICLSNKLPSHVFGFKTGANVVITVQYMKYVQEKPQRKILESESTTM